MKQDVNAGKPIFWDQTITIPKIGIAQFAEQWDSSEKVTGSAQIARNDCLGFIFNRNHTGGSSMTGRFRHTNLRIHCRSLDWCNRASADVRHKYHAYHTCWMAKLGAPSVRLFAQRLLGPNPALEFFQII